MKGFHGVVTQDTDTVVLHKKLTKEEAAKQGKLETKLKYGAGKNKTPIDTRKLEGDEIPKIPQVSQSVSKQIMQGRAGKKMTQKELANLTSLPIDTIQKYENGKAIPKGVEMQKISKALGITLKKKKNN